MFASADLGRPLWVQSFAQKFNTALAFIQKVSLVNVSHEHANQLYSIESYQSRSGESTHVLNVIGNVSNKHVIICMILLFPFS